MKIRAIEPRDLEQVALLCEQLGYPSTASDVARRFELVSRTPDIAIFVAELEGAVVGWIDVHLDKPTLVADSRAELGALIVDQKVRGKRIGSLLLARAEDWARERGLSVIRLRSNTKREDAHRFYQREGYSLSKTSCVFVKEL